MQNPIGVQKCGCDSVTCFTAKASTYRKYYQHGIELEYLTSIQASSVYSSQWQKNEYSNLLGLLLPTIYFKIGFLANLFVQFATK